MKDFDLNCQYGPRATARGISHPFRERRDSTHQTIIKLKRIIRFHGISKQET